MNKANGKIQFFYWMVVAALILLFGFLVSWKLLWIVGVAGGVLSYPITKAIESQKYASLHKKQITGRNYAPFR